MRLLRAHRQKVLYLVVGGWNTVFQYSCFSLLYYVLHRHLFSSAIVLLSYFISSINGFLGFRYIVFGPTGHPLLEYLKFQTVYVPLLVVNMAVLPLALRYLDLNAYVIQALFGGAAIVVGYLGNKYFTFRPVAPKA